MTNAADTEMQKSEGRMYESKCRRKFVLAFCIYLVLSLCSYVI